MTIVPVVARRTDFESKGKPGEEMDTYFAPAARASAAAVEAQVLQVTGHPVVTALMKVAAGLVAVLNEQRQLLALNPAFMKELGISDPATVFGLRPGEAVGCLHAHDENGGCGTSLFCASCGAAIAIVAALANNRPEERLCALTAVRQGRPVDLCFRVRTCTLDADGQRLVLLFMQDITEVQRWSALERVFLHDLSGLATGLRNTTSRLATAGEAELPALNAHLRAASSQLAREIQLQRCLLFNDAAEPMIPAGRVAVMPLLEQLRAIFATHPQALGKQLELPEPAMELEVDTEASLLLRVLTNMLENALEAAAPGATVKLAVRREDGEVQFTVWDPGVIPPAVSARIFQRFFSTKPGDGRGLGTYSMKLIGEKLLGGKVSFTTSAEEGTTFRLSLPG